MNSSDKWVPEVTISVADLPADYFHMIPQAAVRHVEFPPGTPQNSIWDFVRNPDGRFFLSLCGEGSRSECASVYEFLPASQTLRFCFNLRRECLVSARSIPPSKVHSSMCSLPDGRMIMTTHTTARGPSHPCWLLDSYYSHQWEGYDGSQILMFDPKSGDVRSLGTPLPRESIYGAKVDSQCQALYFLGYLRGHLYRFDLRSREVRDFGQVTEFGSFRLVPGPDGHLYGGSRSGALYRINVDRQEIEDLGIIIPPAPNPFSHQLRQLNFGAIGPDGRLYFTFVWADHIYAYDVKSNTLESLGRFEPEPRIPAVYPRTLIGFAFDRQGRLWYGQSSQVGTRLGVQMLHLCRWDILRGKPPELLGGLGTTERSAAGVSEFMIAGDQLYASATNHAEDPPGVLTIDLAAIDRHRSDPPAVCRDPHAYLFIKECTEVYPGDDYETAILPYRKTYGWFEQAARFTTEQARFDIEADAVQVVRLWQYVPAGCSAVRELHGEADGTIQGVCGGESFYRFVIRKGQNVETTPLDRAQFSPPDPLAGLPDIVRQIKLPARRGRQFLAKPSCWSLWLGSQILVGTTDGLVAKIDPDSGQVFSYGAIAPHGPVHQLVTTRARTRAFGVAGDDSDLGQAFMVDERAGVRELGRTYFSGDAQTAVANSCQPRCLALSPDEKVLAIGVQDRLGCVYLYRGVRSETTRPRN